jgi:hypothetical protein
MIATFNRRGMITIFPVSSLSILSLIEFLTRSTSRQLHGIGDHIPVAIIRDEQVNVIGCDHIIQESQPIPPPGLIKPVQIPMPILRELEKEFPLMASMGDMPDVARNVMSLCSCHRYLRKHPFWGSKKGL